MNFKHSIYTTQMNETCLGVNHPYIQSLFVMESYSKVNASHVLKNLVL